MIGMVLCSIGRHDWRPVWKRTSMVSGERRSLVRCYRRRGSGMCLAERYTTTVPA